LSEPRLPRCLRRKKERRAPKNATKPKIHATTKNGDGKDGDLTACAAGNWDVSCLEVRYRGEEEAVPWFATLLKATEKGGEASTLEEKANNEATTKSRASCTVTVFLIFSPFPLGCFCG